MAKRFNFMKRVNGVAEKCNAIKMNGDNSYCDDKNWCRKGIAHYLRTHGVLETIDE